MTDNNNNVTLVTRLREDGEQMQTVDRHDVRFIIDTDGGTRHRTLDNLLLAYESQARMLTAIHTVVHKFRDGIVNGDPVSVDDWDDLAGVFAPLREYADLTPPEREFNGYITISATVHFEGLLRGDAVNWDEDKIGEVIGENLDLSHYIDVIEAHDDDDFVVSQTYGSIDFECDYSSVEIDD